MSLSIATLQTLMCTPGLGGRRGLRPLFWGKPGVGKTAALETLCRAMGAHLITIIASIREPADFLGIPMPDGKGGLMYAAPNWAHEANAKAKAGQLVVVFIDELTTCAPAVQAAMLRVVNEGYVGDLRLENNVAFIAAANPVEIAAGGYELSPPMANRWMHLDWNEPSAAQWSEGILSDWAESSTPESSKDVIKRIDGRFEACQAKAKGLVTGYLRANSGDMIVLPDSGNPEASKAWPSHRTWDLCIQTLAGGEANGLSESVMDDLIEGCIGRGVAGQLRQYQAEADLPDPVKLLTSANPDKIWKHNPERADITAAVLNSCAALVTPPKATDRKQRAENMWVIIDGVVKDAGDVAVMAARSVARANLSQSKVARKVMVKMGPIMSAMGEI